MSEGKKYYCTCDSNCKYETMTKEQIMAAIAQAVATGVVGDVDTGFVSKVLEKNCGRHVTFWVGTQAQYNAIEAKEENCMYIITDDNTKAEIEQLVQQLQQGIAQLEEVAAAASFHTVEEYTHIDDDRAEAGYPNFLTMRKYSTGIAEAEIITRMSNVPFTTSMNGFYAANHETLGNWFRLKWESLTTDDEKFAESFNPATLFKCDISCSTIQCKDEDGSLFDVGGMVLCSGNFTKEATQRFAILATRSAHAAAYLRISLAWRWKDGV